MVVYAFNPGTYEVEASGSLPIQDQPGLYIVSYSQDYRDPVSK